MGIKNPYDWVNDHPLLSGKKLQFRPQQRWNLSQSAAPNPERHYHPKYQHVRTKKPAKQNFKKKTEHPHDNTPSSTWWFQPTYLKNIYSSKSGSSSPNFRGEHNNNIWVETHHRVSSKFGRLYHGSFNKTTTRKHRGPGASKTWWRGTSKFGTFFSKGKKQIITFFRWRFQIRFPMRFHQDGTPKPINKTLW